MDQAGSSPVAAADQDQDRSRALEEHITAFTNKLCQARSDLADEETKNFKKQLEIARMARELDRAHESLSRKDREIKRLKEELKQGKQCDPDVKEKLKEMVSAVKTLHSMVSSHVPDAEGDATDITDENCLEELRRKLFQVLNQSQKNASELWEEIDKRVRLDLVKTKELVKK